MNLTQNSNLIATAILAIGSVTTFPSPAQASQDNFCQCLVTQSSPCTCTKNWKISPLATHTYYGMCDVDGDGHEDYEIDGYTMSFAVNGRDKMTDCTRTKTVSADEFQGSGSVNYLAKHRGCTNWSLTKKDSTSTVVTCKVE